MRLVLVEGEMEKVALRKHFGVRAQRIGVNGDSVRVETIARAINAQLAVRDDINQLVVVFDREGRAESAQDIVRNLTSMLRRRWPQIDIKVAVSDRDMEAWLFADIGTIVQHFKRRITASAAFEGTNGAREIRKYLGVGRYEKMTDGVQLIGSVDWREVERRSASARDANASAIFCVV